MKRVALLGGILLAVGSSIVFAQLITFPGMLFGGCTEVAVPESQDQGASIIGVQDSELRYTPDGTNECSIPLSGILVPTGFVAVGGGLVLSTWY